MPSFDMQQLVCAAQMNARFMIMALALVLAAASPAAAGDAYYRATVGAKVLH